MAKKAAEAVADDATEGKKKGGLKKIIIISLILVLVIALGVVAAFILHARNSADNPGGKDAHAEEAKHDEKPPVYEKLEVFTVNLSGGGNYLQTEIALKVADAGVSEQIKQRMPEIRNAIIELLSSKTQADLSTVQGKQKLADQIQLQVNSLLEVKTAEEGVSRVLFSTFIIQ